MTAPDNYFHNNRYPHTASHPHIFAVFLFHSVFGNWERQGMRYFKKGRNGTAILWKNCDGIIESEGSHLKNILQRAVRTKAHSSMYIMLTIGVAMFFVYTGLVGNSQMVSVMDSIEYTLPVWMTALICILAVFSFVYYRYLCIYTLDFRWYRHNSFIKCLCCFFLP